MKNNTARSLPEIDHEADSLHATVHRRLADHAARDVRQPELAAQAQELLDLVATANDGSADAVLRKGARDALRPIDALRDANARRNARNTADNDGDDASAEDVIPDVA